MMRQAFETTVAIMREMSTSPSHWNSKRSYSDIANKLGIDEETVRSRIRSLKDSGFLRGWRLIINARLLGKMSTVLVVEVDSGEAKAKDNIVKEIAQVSGVVLIQSFYGKTLQLTLFSDDNKELERQRKIIASIAMGKFVTEWDVHLPRCDHKPKQTDWLIIGALLKDADKKIPEIADELRISARTVKRRLNMMMSSSAFFIQPVLDLAKVAGALPCQLLIVVSSSKEQQQRQKTAIDNFITSTFDRIAFALTDSLTHSIFTIICTNLAEARSIAEEIQKHEGVALARIEIIEELRYVSDWMAKEVRTRATTTTAAAS